MSKRTSVLESRLMALDTKEMLGDINKVLEVETMFLGKYNHKLVNLINSIGVKRLGLTAEDALQLAEGIIAMEKTKKVMSDVATRIGTIRNELLEEEHESSKRAHRPASYGAGKEEVGTRSSRKNDSTRK